jgi:hypothetical protein
MRSLNVEEALNRIENRPEALKNMMLVNFEPEMRKAIAAGIIEDSPAVRDFLIRIGIDGLRAGLATAFSDPVD